MKVGFEIYFENDEMTVHAPNLFTYRHSKSEIGTLNCDPRRIDADEIEFAIYFSQIYDHMTLLSEKLGELVLPEGEIE